MKMKYLGYLVLVLGITLSSALPRRTKREAYDLPDGSELLIADVATTFNCNGNGYYADTDNNCQIFHVCHSTVNADGSLSSQQWSFICGNQTVFNQLTFTCGYPEESIPCENAPDFYYLNDNVQLGDPEVHFLSDQDIERAAPLIPGLGGYGARIPAAQPPPAAQRPGRGG